MYISRPIYYEHTTTNNILPVYYFTMIDLIII